MFSLGVIDVSGHLSRGAGTSGLVFMKTSQANMLIIEGEIC